jgi:hypothetical protein
VNNGQQSIVSERSIAVIRDPLSYMLFHQSVYEHPDGFTHRYLLTLLNLFEHEQNLVPSSHITHFKENMSAVRYGTDH